MSKTLNETLEDVRHWKEEVAAEAARLNPHERAAYWEDAINAASRILDRPLRLSRSAAKTKDPAVSQDKDPA